MTTSGTCIRVALTVLVVLGLAPEAAAHADLVKAVPAPGGHVDAPPTEALLWYTEGLQHAVVSVQDRNNHRVDVGRVVIDPDDRKAVRIPLGELPDAPGIYTLRWEVLSDDGHTTSGSFFFIVGGLDIDRETLLAMFAPAEQGGYQFYALEPIFRGLLLIAIVALLGTPLTSRFAIRHALQSADAPAEARDHADRLTRRLVTVAGFLLLGDAAALALLRTATAFGSIDAAKVADFAATGLGRMWIVQSVAAIVALGSVAARRAAAVHFAAPVAGLAAAWSVASSSHSATYVTGATGLVADVGHMLGAALWAGGILAMTLVAGPVLAGLPDPAARALAARIIARFTLFALLGLGLAASSGLLIASWHVPGPRSLLTTLYGSTLSVKVVLVLAALALGATARLYVLRRLRSAGDDAAEAPRSPVRLLRTLVGIETLLLVLVLLASGLMTSAPTALAASYVAPTLGVVEQQAPLDGGRVLLKIVPTRIGLNVFDLRVVDGQNSPMATDDVTFVLRHPRRGVELDPIEAKAIEPGLWSAVSALSMDGVWSLRVSFWRAGSFLAHRFHFPVASEALEARLREAAIPPPTAEAGTFMLFLRIAAVLSALLAVGALIVEAVQRARPRMNVTAERARTSPR